MSERTWGFKSPLAHHTSPTNEAPLRRGLVASPAPAGRSVRWQSRGVPGPRVPGLRCPAPGWEHLGPGVGSHTLQPQGTTVDRRAVRDERVVTAGPPGPASSTTRRTRCQERRT
ncbi:hypothetical protein FTX61_05240 [Nitriliruptoraceae bacterium ZYF776]|nr:hypothetical protein [Profundirhabdus halotolerans]